MARRKKKSTRAKGGARATAAPATATPSKQERSEVSGMAESAASDARSSTEALLLSWLQAAINGASLSSSAPGAASEALAPTTMRTEETAVSTRADWPSAEPTATSARVQDAQVSPLASRSPGKDETPLTATTAAAAAAVRDVAPVPGTRNEVENDKINVASSSTPHTQQLDQQLPNASLPLRPRRRLAVHDIMPLFDALLAGQLGPVVIDVQLQGHTRLLQSPQQFEATLQSYGTQSSGPLKEALSSVQPFFFLCSRAEGSSGREQQQPQGAAEALATVATAELSAASGVSSPLRPTLYTLDPRKHYPAVPLLAKLLRSSTVTKVLLHSRLLYRLLFLFLGTDRVDIQRVVDLTTWSHLGRQLRSQVAAVHPLPAEGVLRLADVQALLPRESRTMLEEEVSMLTTGSGSDDDETVYAPRNDNSSIRSSSEEGREKEEEEGAQESAGMARRSSPSQGEGATEGENNDDDDNEQGRAEKDAVELLQTIVPLHQQPLDSSAGVDIGGARIGTKRPRQASQRAHCERTRRLRRHHDSAALADIYGGLKSLTLYYTEVLATFFDNVTGAVGPAVTPALHAMTTSAASRSPSPAPRLDAAVCQRISPSELCEVRTYADFLCEVMTYHGFFVDDSVFYGMTTVLDVQLQTLEDLAERVLTTLENQTGDLGEDDREEGVQSTPASAVMSEERFRQCIARGPTVGAALLTSHQKLDASLLHDLARKAVATQLRLSCQLVCIWIAFRERTEIKRKMTDMFSKVSDHVQARVLERPRDAFAVDVVDRTHSPASWSEMCFSVHPTWTVHHSTTARMFSSMPNIQNLKKLPLVTTFSLPALRATPAKKGPTTPQPFGSADAPTKKDVERWVRLTTTHSHGASLGDEPETNPCKLLFPEQPKWTLRHFYRAPPGCVLLSFDFNQLELRVLAQLSGDVALQRHLSSDVDVLTLTTASLLKLPSPDAVQPHQRQAVKVIVYGLLYGMGPRTMDERIARVQKPTQPNDNSNGAGLDGRLSAAQLITRFHEVYPRVESYLRETRQVGAQERYVETLSGRKAVDGAASVKWRKQRAIALAIQGGAGDIVLMSMRAVHQQRHSLLPYLPAAPFALVSSIHDELVYAVPRVAEGEVARAVKCIMEDQSRVLRLAVPLPVSVRVGKSFGGLKKYSFD